MISSIKNVIRYVTQLSIVTDDHRNIIIIFNLAHRSRTLNQVCVTETWTRILPNGGVDRQLLILTTEELPLSF